MVKQRRRLLATLLTSGELKKVLIEIEKPRDLHKIERKYFIAEKLAFVKL